MEIRVGSCRKVALELRRAGTQLSNRIGTPKDSGSIFQGAADNRTMSGSVGLELNILEERGAKRESLEKGKTLSSRSFETRVGLGIYAESPEKLFKGSRLGNNGQRPVG